MAAIEMRLIVVAIAALVSAQAMAQAAPATRQPAVTDRPTARAAAPSAYDSKVAKARALMKTGSASAALVASREAIALDDKRWEAYVTAAGAYSSQNFFDDSIGMLQAALARAPDDRRPLIRDAIAEARRALSTPQEAAPQPASPAARPATRRESRASSCAAG